MLIIRHSQAEIDRKKQIIWIALSAGLQIITIIIGVSGGAGFDNTGAPNNDNVPVWQWYYALYVFGTNALVIILAIYNAYVARKGFTDATMRKRFSYFLLAMVLLFWLMCMNPWANLTAVSAFRTAYALSALVIIPGAILLYLSLGKEVDKRE